MPVDAKRRPVVLAAVVGRVALEVGAGGVEEQQVDLEVEQIGRGEEHGLLNLGLRVGIDEQVHRAVGVIVVHGLQAGDVDIVAGPLRGGQLGARTQAAVGDQREHHALHVGREAPRPHHALQRLGDPELLPQAPQQPDAAQRARATDHEALTDALKRTVLADVPGDRARQAPQRLDVELVLAAQIDQHPRAHNRAGALVVGQL